MLAFLFRWSFVINGNSVPSFFIVSFLLQMRNTSLPLLYPCYTLVTHGHKDSYSHGAERAYCELPMQVLISCDDKTVTATLIGSSYNEWYLVTCLV